MPYLLCDPTKENVNSSELKLAADDSEKSKHMVDCYKVFEIPTADFDEIRLGKKVVKWSGDTYELIEPQDYSSRMSYVTADDVTKDLNDVIVSMELYMSNNPNSPDVTKVQSFVDSIKNLTFDDLTFPHIKGIEDIIEAKGITYLHSLQLQ